MIIILTDTDTDLEMDLERLKQYPSLAAEDAYLFQIKSTEVPINDIKRLNDSMETLLRFA